MALIRRRRCRLRTSVRWCCVAGENQPRTRTRTHAAVTADEVGRPHINRQLTIVLSDIERAFADPSVPEWKRELACDNLVTPTPAAIMGWDIIDLFLPHTGWLRTGRCGVPIINTEDPAGCGNTVEVDGACHLAGTVNYAMYGIACRLCSDRHRKVLPVGLDSWTLGDMKFWVGFYNVADTTGGGIGPPTDWAAATYLGGPTGRPTSANRSSCPVVGRVPLRIPASILRGHPFAARWITDPVGRTATDTKSLARLATGGRYSAGMRARIV